MADMLFRRRRRHGYAMALMLVVLMVVTTITVTVVSTAVRDQESSRTAAARSEARLLGLYALEEFASRVTADPSLPAAAFAASPGTIQNVHPALWSGNSERWVPLPTPESRTPSGDPACETFQVDCYHLTLPTDAVLPELPGNPVAFTVVATVRIRCGGSETRCVYASFQQRLRSAQFFDFLLSHELTTLAPEALFASGSWESSPVDETAYGLYKESCSERASVREQVSLVGLTRTVGVTNHSDGLYTPESSADVTGCLDIAYQSDGNNEDTLKGPIYTTDDYITICESPTLGDVFVSGPGWSGKVYRSAPGCLPATPDPGTATWVTNQPFLVQPTSEKVVNDALRNFDASQLLRFEKADSATPVELRFTPTGVDVAGVAEGSGVFDYEGKVIVVRAPSSNWGSIDVLVSGTVAGATSVVVEGSVAIDDDLVYDTAVVNNCTQPGGSGHTRNCLSGNDVDVLSLTATERIEIWQACEDPDDQSCTGTSGDRFVHGIFTSPQGHVGTPDWQSNIDPTLEPGERRSTLHFYGSVASRFQGVYGSYGPATNGVRSLLSGFNKNFVHDDRLTRFTRGDSTLGALPPYVVESRIPVWVRLDVSEVGVSAP